MSCQIGQGPYLGMWELGQVIDAMVLSVVVRCGPVRTAVNGKLVARPGSMRAAQKATPPGRSAMVQGWATRPATLSGWSWRMPGRAGRGLAAEPEIVTIPGENRPAMGVAYRLRGPCGVRLTSERGGGTYERSR